MGICYPKQKECSICYELFIIDDDTLSDLPMMKLYKRKKLFKNLKNKISINQIYKMESAKKYRR
jgi:hypothetical protein